MNSNWTRRNKVALVACGLAVVVAAWYFATRVPPVPQHPLRIGFEHNPPVQIRADDGGFTGLAVETVNEAARRAGVRLQWVDTGTSSDEAFQKGLVDLWPLMADLPERKKRLHITEPWLHSGHALLLRSGTPTPDRSFTGPIALFRMPLHVRLLHTGFPRAQALQLPGGGEVVQAVCRGTVAAGFLEGRAALAALRDNPAECGSSTPLRIQDLPDLTIRLGVASTFAASGAAEALRHAIGKMFDDGTLAATMAKYSYFGLDDTWATFELMEAERRTRWLTWGLAALAVALILALWQARSLHYARKGAEVANAATAQALSRYQLVSRAARAALLECDLRNGKVVWNEAVHTLFGYSADQVSSGMAWWEDRIHPSDRERVAARMELTIAQRAPSWSDEYRFRRGDGTYASVLDHGHLLYQGGDPVRLVRAVTDVTHQHELEEQLRATQRMEAIGRLAGGIAHDFNNLLTVILGYSNLLEKSVPPGQPSERHVKEIRNAGDQAARLTQQLLAFSRRQLLQPEVVDLNAVINGMTGMLRRLIGEDAGIHVKLAPDLGSVCADRGQIEQVLLNLCVNARDAMPGGGKLTIETANVDVDVEYASRHVDIKPGPSVLLAVSDTGCGMDAETTAHIFEPFFTTKKSGKGTGLGLSTSHGIVKQSGGAICVESELGKGSTFKVFLPRATASTPQEAAPGTRPEAQRGTETILVVEDEDAVRNLVTSILETHGYTVRAACDGEEAVGLLEQHGPRMDLLLTDVVMPRMGGRELGQWLAGRHPGSRILYMSGYLEDGDFDLELQRDRPFLRKPFTATLLLEKVRQALETRAADAQRQTLSGIPSQNEAASG